MEKLPRTSKGYGSARRLNPEAQAVRAHGHVAVTVRPEDGVTIEPVQHLGGGMTERVARADGDHAQPRVDGRQERRRARRAGAVVRHLVDGGSQVGTGAEEGGLPRLADVTGEEGGGPAYGQLEAHGRFVR